MPQATDRVALYPGTFDPVTLGHLDIIRRAARLCDRLVVGVAANPGKKPLFSIEERVDLITRDCAAFGVAVEARPFDTLLVHFAHEVGASSLIRGLRAVADFEYEFQMVGMNRVLDPNVETVFLMADAQHQAIASRLVKEIARLGGDVSKFVTPGVLKALKDKLGAAVEAP